MSDAAANTARQTFFAMLATFLANGVRDASDFASLPASGDGTRVFLFENQPFFIARRTRHDLFKTPGINVYFGDDIEDFGRRKPRKWTVPAMIHVNVPWGKNHVAAEQLAARLGDRTMAALDGIGGQFQVCDFSSGSPVPVAGRFLSWVKSPSWVWREESDPNEDSYTNRMLSIELRYARD